MKRKHQARKPVLKPRRKKPQAPKPVENQAPAAKPDYFPTEKHEL